MSLPEYKYNDGGRKEAGYKGKTGDCGVRAIAIATDRPYKEVYEAIASIKENWKGRSRKAQKTRAGGPGKGVFPEVIEAYLQSIGGWQWIKSKVRIDDNRLQSRSICRVRKHFFCIIEDVVHDTFDDRMTCAVEKEDGEFIPSMPRCAFSYWVPKY